MEGRDVERVLAGGAEVWTAVGTIALAVITVAGLGLSYLINKADRKRADAQAHKDREAAAALASTDRAALREDAQRRHLVDLLLELGRQIARDAGFYNSPQGEAARQSAALVLAALPPECARAARQRYGVERSGGLQGVIDTKMRHLDLQSVGAAADVRQMQREIAYDIDRYLTSGKAPDDVWTDMDELQEWQRARWPRMSG
jgi:hypothetical protein